MNTTTKYVKTYILQTIFLHTISFLKKNQPGIHRMQEKKENLLSLKIIVNSVAN